MCDRINAIIALNKNGGSKPPPYGILNRFATPERKAKKPLSGREVAREA